MKALVCGSCGDIQALQPEWRECQCGKTSARWVNPQRGTAIFRDTSAGTDRTKCFILGLNNQLLVPALLGQLGIWEDFRVVHKAATEAPGYIFDASRAGCWAVIVQAGRTSDVTWEEVADAA